MKSTKMELLKIYKSIDTIPIFNLMKVFETNDLRYLLKIDVDSIDSYPITENLLRELKSAYSNMLKEFPNIDFTLQILWSAVLETYANYIRNQNKLQEHNNQFHKYINYLSANYENFRFGEVIFETASELLLYLKEVAVYNDFISFRLDIFDYHRFNAKLKNKTDIISEIISLRDITNQDIDIYKTSFSEYLKIRKYANDKIKKMTNGQ